MRHLLALALSVLCIASSGIACCGQRYTRAVIKYISLTMLTPVRVSTEELESYNDVRTIEVTDKDRLRRLSALIDGLTLESGETFPPDVRLVIDLYRNDGKADKVSMSTSRINLNGYPMVFSPALLELVEDLTTQGQKR